MDDPLDYINILAHRARQEEPPQGDVRRFVAHHLHDNGNRLTKPLMLLTAGYAIATSIALIYGFILFNAINNPVSTIFQMAALSMP
jgi:hypothetical protein